MIYFNVYYFKDGKKHFVHEINFSIKLHDMRFCGCHRIIQDIVFNKIPRYKIKYILERQFWQDDEDIEFRYIYVEKRKFFNDYHLMKLFNPVLLNNKNMIHDIIYLTIQDQLFIIMTLFPTTNKMSLAYQNVTIYWIMIKHLIQE